MSATTEAARERYEELSDLGLELDMTRGKPCGEQLDLSAPLLEALDDPFTPSGVDCRNYGGLDGIDELARIWAPYLGVRPEDLFFGDNSSLTLMHDVLVQALLRGVPGGQGPWRNGKPVKVLCPVPGYDRHFSICQYLGIEMVPVAMGEHGPDLDEVRAKVAEDDRIKAIFCVPRYSNPTGVTYSEETVHGLATMDTAAHDFRIIWDNAYAGHHLYPDPEPLVPMLEACRKARREDRVLVFGSTSKITLAGAGLSMVAGSADNLADLRMWRSKQSIGPDKITQLRHLHFLPDTRAIETQMQRHADILRPKFEAVLEILDEELGGRDVATWTRPRGGYFISLDTRDRCAKRTVDLAAFAGVRLTPAGATFPHGRDPRDRNIRLAPSFPSIEELRQATRVLAVSILLASEKSDRG